MPEKLRGLGWRDKPAKSTAGRGGHAASMRDGELALENS